MAPEHQHLDTFLAAIEAKIAAWKAVADSYRAAVALDGPLSDMGAPAPAGVAKQSQSPSAKPMDLPVGVFRDKSIREAIEILLTAGRRKQTNKEIAIGLQKGGIATTSNFFEATVATALGRMKDDGVVLRFPDGWDLAASYPDSLRNRLEKDAKPQKRKGRKTVNAKSPRTPKASKEPSEPNKSDVILETIRQNGSRINASQIRSKLAATGMEASPDYVRLVLRRLVARGLIQPDGLLGFVPKQPGSEPQ